MKKIKMENGFYCLINTDTNEVITIGTEKKIDNKMNELAPIQEVETVENRFNRLVKEVEIDIKNYIPTFKNTVIKLNNFNDNNEHGRYYGIGNIKFIDININSFKNHTNYEIKTLIAHEIGHYIHDTILKNEQIRFSLEGKTDYAKTNYYENFAEAFMDMIYQPKDRNTEKRTNKIKKVLGIN